MDIIVTREGGNWEASIGREVVEGNGNGTQTKDTDWDNISAGKLRTGGERGQNVDKGKDFEVEY